MSAAAIRYAKPSHVNPDIMFTKDSAKKMNSKTAAHMLQCVMSRTPRTHVQMANVLLHALPIITRMTTHAKPTVRRTAAHMVQSAVW